MACVSSLLLALAAITTESLIDPIFDGVESFPGSSQGYARRLQGSSSSTPPVFEKASITAVHLEAELNAWIVVDRARYGVGSIVPALDRHLSVHTSPPHV